MTAPPTARQRHVADLVRQRIERGGERLWRFEDFGDLPFTAVAFLIAQQLPALTTRPIAVGACYGIGVWLVMNLVVVPLSAANPAARSAPVLINGILIHILGVGIPAWLFAAKVPRAAPQAAL